MTSNQAACTGTGARTTTLTDGGYITFAVLTEISAPAAARRVARETFAAWGLDLDDPTVDSAIVIVSELVTNTAKHARVLCRQAEITLSLIGHRLVIAVHDGHPLRPHALLSPHPDDSGGWGLRLVKELAREAGGTVTVPRDRDGRGKTVRVELSLSSGQQG